MIFAKLMIHKRHQKYDHKLSIILILLENALKKQLKLILTKKTIFVLDFF